MIHYKNDLIAFVFSVLLSIVSGFVIIPFLKKLKAGQNILGYVDNHSSKSGTTTMGGFIFAIPCVITFILTKKSSSVLASISLLVSAGFLLIGFVDDYIKIKSGKNQGLTALQKIIFQTSISLATAIFVCVKGYTNFFIPFYNKFVNLGIFSGIIVFFVFIATTNCVNLTDGLDGLAGGVGFVFLILSYFLISVEIILYNNNFVNESEIRSISLLCLIQSGALLGFLLFNTFKAKVFMGDTGSLYLGGLIATTMIFSGNMLFIPFFGIMFVVSGISVIVQVVHFKRTGKRVFLMAPIHHHFEYKGHSESKIVFAYKLITLLVGTICIILVMRG